jgi:hypothetical protein
MGPEYQRENHNGTSLIIPEYKGQVFYFENIPLCREKFFWQFPEVAKGQGKPVYSIWNYNHHREIAEALACGKVCAMYVWGVWGVAMLLNSPEWQKEQGKESATLREVKKGRPWGKAFASFIYPDGVIDFWDIDRFHPRYRELQWAAKRWRLWEKGPVHIIAPTKSRNPHMDEWLLTRTDGTASYFYMPHPGWNRIIEMLRKDVKHAVYAGGSLNFDQEEPGFTTEVLYKMMQEKEEWREHIDLVVIDEICELMRFVMRLPPLRTGRSQTQIRLPQKGSDGICEIVRYGGLSPETFSQYTGYPVKEATDVRFASSETLYDEKHNLIADRRIAQSLEVMRAYDQFVRKGK